MSKLGKWKWEASHSGTPDRYPNGKKKKESKVQIKATDIVNLLMSFSSVM